MPLKLYPPPSGIYHVRGASHGIRIDQSARTRDKREAERFLEDLAAECRRRGEEARRPRNIADAITGYLEAGGEDRYMNPVIDELGEKPLSRINQQIIDQAARRAYPKAKPSTLNRQFYTPVSAVLNYAADQGWMDRRRIRRPKQPQGRVDWRTPEEIETLLSVSGHLKPLLTFLAGTGCRLTEAIELEWEDVSPEGERVVFWETKAGYARHADLQPRVRDILPERGEGRIWRNSRGHGWHAYDAINLGLRKITERHGLPHISAHVFRHTWATWAYACTKDLTFLMQQGGWRSVNMVMRYAHTGSDDLAREVEKYGWSFGKKLGR